MNLNVADRLPWTAAFATPEANLAFAWLWILAGFLSGMLMGLFFHRENWLGGYGSHPRRLLRLGHISFFGLAGINLAFYLTVRAAGLDGHFVALAGPLLILGGLAMPVCCALMAWKPRLQFLFCVPVLSLLAGAILTITTIVL